MNLLVRWGTTLTLVGSTLLATVFSGNAPVLALTEQQIKEKLDPVPVFLITNNQGVPLTRTVPNNGQNAQKKEATVTDVFMSGQEAQAFINQLRNVQGKNPKMAEMLKSLQVTPVPLGMIYQRLRDNAKKPDSLVFAFNPGKQDIEGAMALLRQSGKEVKQFPSVPIFIVRSPEKGYVSVKRKTDNKEVIPLFLSQKDAQGLLNQVKQQVPKADIQVVDIDGIIQTLRAKNDPWLNQVTIVPSSETMQYIVSKQNNAPKPAAPAAPKK
ncbi:Tic22 family protein [Mastigocladopsis repens]|uniref:Tic22 family protein n=1 Tax=Mastigocladopsis repens TaxID=221287 RepID=UPI0002E0B31E|nr:Tic22 family protein [Mastigocladopsis repens]